jgi:hypothetical protein
VSPVELTDGARGGGGGGGAKSYDGKQSLVLCKSFNSLWSKVSDFHKCVNIQCRIYMNVCVNCLGLKFGEIILSRVKFQGKSKY